MSVIPGPPLCTRTPWSPARGATHGAPGELQVLVADALRAARTRIGESEQPAPAPRPLNVGFVTIWFEHGQAHVARTLREAVASSHRTFVFARTGIVHEMRQLDISGSWDIPDLTRHPSHEIPSPALVNWVNENRLDVVVFSDESNGELVRAVRATGAAAVTHLDLYRHEWRPMLAQCDAILCSTRRTLRMVEDLGNAHYVGWGIDTDLFRPRDSIQRRHTFFHNAGWLGVNYRKMTPTVIVMFDALSRCLPNISLFVHAQAGPEKLPSSCRQILARNPRITYHVASVPAPGLYHRGEILLFPSRLEGLGLALPEGMACGLPAIATHAPPMDEIVVDGENGLLVRAGNVQEHHDGIAFPETIVDEADLAKKMALLALDRPRACRMGERAREMIVDRFGLAAFQERVKAILEAAAVGTASRGGGPRSATSA